MGFIDFPNGTAGKESACNAGDTGDTGLISGSGRSHGGGKWQPISVFLPKKPHTEKSVGYGHRGPKKLGTTEQLSMTMACICVTSLELRFKDIHE